MLFVLQIFCSCYLLYLIFVLSLNYSYRRSKQFYQEKTALTFIEKEESVFASTSCKPVMLDGLFLIGSKWIRYLFVIVHLLMLLAILDILVENPIQQLNTLSFVHGCCLVNTVVVFWSVKKWPWSCCCCNPVRLYCSTVFDLPWSLQVRTVAVVSASQTVAKTKPEMKSWAQSQEFVYSFVLTDVKCHKCNILQLFTWSKFKVLRQPPLWMWSFMLYSLWYH